MERHTEEKKLGPEQFEHEGVPLVGVDTAKALYQTGQDVEFVCVLTEEFFKNKVIEGSHWIPLDKIDTEFELKIPDKDTLIITYCAGYHCPQSLEATRKLRSMGYRHVLDFKGGIEEWEQHGLPMETLERERTQH